jgi:4-methylaminobutanoate oxidase (formaldehyde-forming)
LLERRARGPLQRKLVSVLVKDPRPLLFHAEVVWRDDEAVGYVRAASYGHTLQGAVGLAMIEPKRTVDDAYLSKGTWEVEVNGTRYPCVVSARPLYDPRAERTRM